jgi:hypothetical protein
LVESPVFVKLVAVVVLPTKEYVPVEEVARYTSYPLAPLTAVQLVLMLEYEADAAFGEAGTASTGFAETTGLNAP